ncbi:unnamed protein product [Rhizoctonia solani]|uniref:Jacalin-type lectin domain-containing protein n=1 Tax=Rhizoctonia solani TaxID=456999 RepID=A0A8H3H632_9AGAM|nr:unnamed protein product [Rhizoctonia solani]
MSTGQATHANDSGNNNPPLSLEFATNPNPSENNHILMNSGWLCGYRVENLTRPQVLPHQVASYIDGATPFVEETNEILSEVVTTYSKRESNYVHHGWSVGAITTISPWTLSRIHATNQKNVEGVWVTKKNLVVRCRVQVLLQDLAPVPEFVAAIEEALGRSTRFEKFQAVYHALSRWGDVVPLEIEIGSSLTSTDTEANFSQLPAVLYNNLAHLSILKTSSMIRKGASSNAKWDDWTWTTTDIPATEWRPITIVTVAPTFSLLTNDLQAQLAELYMERLSYTPPLTIDPIFGGREIYDGTHNTSRTISQVEIRIGSCIDRLSLIYRDGMVSRGGGEGGAEHSPFALANGEYITEMLTCNDGNWLRGIQFVTDMGRCSVIYGQFEGILTIARSKGGFLAGLIIRTRMNVYNNEAIAGIWGIWRHDYISRVPKENDVYSDYFGAKAQHGAGFNDRAIIGNSSAMYISSVEVHFGTEIDSIQNGKIKTACHGGTGGNYRKFELEDGEHIVSISGRCNEKVLTQLCFGTNLGRTSEIYGIGGGQEFSARAPQGENGRYLRLQYILGKSDSKLNGIMFAWTPI